MKNFALTPKKLSIALLMGLILLLAVVPLVYAYTINSIWFTWDAAYSGGSIAMHFNATATQHWGVSGRLLPLPEQNFGAWKFGWINGYNYRYMVVGALMGESYRICLGASDTDPGASDLYYHPNNRCFRVWRSSSTTVAWVEVFNIYGHVADGSGNPMAGVTISDGAGHTALTDGSGNYYFHNLDASTYTLTPSLSGYTFSPASRSASGGPPFNVTGQDFTGTAIPQTYSISGRIADGNNVSMSGVAVSDGAGHTATTDANGNFSFSGLGAGNYTLTPSKGGYTFNPVSRAVSVPPDATGQNFTAVPIPIYSTISGKVVNADNNNNPLAGVTVSLSNGATTTTDTNGNYTFGGVAAGSYTLTPSKSGMSFAPSTRSVTVPPNAVGQDFTANPQGYFISGRVTDGNNNPIGGVPLKIDGIGWSLNATTDNNGYYIYSGLTAGYYGVGSAPGSSYTLSPRYRTYAFLTWNAGYQDFSITPRYGSVSGKVTSLSTGTSIAGATIVVGGKTGSTDSNGNYSIVGILPGDQPVRVQADNFESYASSVSVSSNINTVQNVSLKPIRVDGYYLPYVGGRGHMFTQGNNNPPPGSHSGTVQLYAFDIGHSLWDEKGPHKDDLDVVAVRDGKVTDVHASTGPKDGTWIRILHRDGTVSFYLHLASFIVSKGQPVRSGQIIGTMGMTGADAVHLHFNRFASDDSTSANFWKSISTRFSDPAFSEPAVAYQNGIPQAWFWYQSGNYLQLQKMLEPVQDTEPPFGSIGIGLTGIAGSYQLKLWSEDLDSEVNQMRLAPNESGVTAATWTPYSTSMAWTYPTAYIQYKDSAGNVSLVYSDTIQAIGYEPIQAAFTVSPTVCVNHELPQFFNQTNLICEQCNWQWDFGNGNISTAINPTYDPEVRRFGFYGYDTPGIYTITLSVKSVNAVSSASRVLEALPAPTGIFTLTRSGATVHVESGDWGASDWRWRFGDGTEATGRIATHTYTNTQYISSYPVELIVTQDNGCSTSTQRYIDPDKYLFLPLIRR